MRGGKTLAGIGFGGLMGCALLWAADPALPDAAKPPRRTVVVLGDSLAAGFGVEPKEAYPALLQQKVDAAGLPFTVVNAGVSGDTTAGGLRRLDWVLRQPAEVLVLELGGNDGLRGLAPEATRSNLVAIIGKARAKNPETKVVLAGMVMPDNMGDQIHPTAKGHALVASNVWVTLEPVLREVAVVRKLEEAK
jgi:acyl-CoA thioesterase-1